MGSSTSDRARARRVAARLALAACVAAPAARAQAPLPGDAGEDGAGPVATLADGTRRVRGRVVSPAEGGEAGVGGVWVTLHRVGSDAAGPLDSVRSDGAGRFAFTYRPRGDARAVYFVAASRGGVAYFGSPLRGAVVEGEPAELVVFDTSSAAGKVHATGHHLIVARPGPGGVRDVVEVYELGNDSSVTFVPPAGAARGVWSTALPAAATDFVVRENSDVPPDGLVAVGGRATLMVPVAPGLKQVAYSYKLPARAFPLRVPVASGTGVLEVLLEEPLGSASGAGLAPAGPVALEGKTFRRFLSQSVAAGGTVDVRVGEAAGTEWGRYAVPVLLGVVGGAMAIALVLAGRRRPPAPTPGVAARRPANGERDRLLADLAALDDAFADGSASAEQREAYAARRSAIKARLAAELAGAPGGT